MVPHVEVSHRSPASRKPSLPCSPRGTGRRSPAQQIAAALPAKHPLLIETFGGPLSPLNETELQIELVRHSICRACWPLRPRCGAIARTLHCLAALAGSNIRPAVVVLLGKRTTSRRSRSPVTAAFAWCRPVADDLGPRGDSASSSRTACRIMEVSECLDASVTCPLNGDGNKSTLLSRDRRSVWHPYTPLLDPDEPLPVVAAQDEFLTLADGRRSSTASRRGGRSCTATATRDHGQACAKPAQIDHVLFAGVTHPQAVELAELLLAHHAVDRRPRVLLRQRQHRGRSRAQDGVPVLVPPRRTAAHAVRRLRARLPRRHVRGDGVSRDPLFFGRFEPLLFRAVQVPLSADDSTTHWPARGRSRGGRSSSRSCRGAGGMRHALARPTARSST